MVEAGVSHSCLVLINGEGMCFGNGNDGRLGSDDTQRIGDGVDSARLAATGIVKLPPGAKAVAISAGNSHSCAVLDDGQALCFGKGDDGRLGSDAVLAIGDGTDTTRLTATGIVKLPPGAKAVAISAGIAHTCAVLDDGQALCFGKGDDGRLGSDAVLAIGDGTDTTRLTATGIVKLPPGAKAVAISAGTSHSCAVLDDGRALCFGQGGDGRLGSDDTLAIGDGTDTTRLTATGIVKLPPGAKAVAISAGDSHTCAVLDDGQALCFGRGNSGRLGSDDTLAIGDGTDTTRLTATGIVKLPPGAKAVAISAGTSHTCAVLDDGQALCFGSGGNGRLGSDDTLAIGDGTDTTRLTATGIVKLPPGAKAVAISAGSGYTCAVLDDGRALCFGSGSLGRRGSDSTSSCGDGTDPARITASCIPILPLSDYTLAAFAARASTCSISASATVACWGSNAQGQIGSGNSNTVGDDETASSIAAVSLPSNTDAVALFMGPQHTCALLQGGQLSCWGNAAEGRLGYGDDTTAPGRSSTPASAGALPTRPDSTLITVALGEGHSCALYDSDAACRNRPLVCWGRNDAGQLGLGDGNTAAHLDTPATAAVAQLHAGETVIDMDAGKDHTCAIYASGDMACWGEGGSGRLGSGSTTTIGLTQTPGSLPMVPLPAGRSAVQVSCGDEHTCVVLDNGELICFGAGGSGRLGYSATDSLGQLPSTTPDKLDIVQLPPNRTVAQVSAGAKHTCAVLDDATVACWGEGDDGRLGYGNTTDVGDDEHPSDTGIVRMPFDQPVASVSAGDKHTCATLRVGGIVCWGASPNGELGRGNTDTVGNKPWLQPQYAHTLSVPPLLTAADVTIEEQAAVPPLCSPTPSMTSTPTPSYSPTGSGTPSYTPSYSPTGSGTPTPSYSPTGSGTPTPSYSPTGSGTPTPSYSPTGSGTPTPSYSPTGSGTATPSYSPTGSGTATPSSSPTGSGTATPSYSPTGSGTPTPSYSPTGSGTPTPSSSPTGSGTPTPSFTPTSSTSPSDEAPTPEDQVGGTTGAQSTTTGSSGLQPGPIVTIVLVAAVAVGAAAYVIQRRRRGASRRPARPVPAVVEVNNAV